jgi:hypothetical protein
VRTPTRPRLRRSWPDGSWQARARRARAPATTAAPRSLRVSSGTCAPLLPRPHEVASRPPAGPVRGARRAVRSEIKTVPRIRIRRGLPYLAVVAFHPANRSDDPIAVVPATRLVSPQVTFRHAQRGAQWPTYQAFRDSRTSSSRRASPRRAPWRGGAEETYRSYARPPSREPTRQTDLTEGPVPEWLSR